MSTLLLGLTLVLGIALASWGLRRRWLHEVAVRRLQAGVGPAPAPAEHLPVQPAPVIDSYPLVPWAAGGATVLGLALQGTKPEMAGAIGAVVGVLAWLLLAWLHDRAATRLEGQLADAIDLMVGALRAGSGLLDALDAAAREVRLPLRHVLEQTIEQIRLGGAPVEVFHALPERAPLEPFVLFATTLAVHWETGGSLAGTLAGVGETIRERNELARRVRAQAAQARASVVGILGIVWLLGIGGLVATPERTRPFLASTAGSFMISGTVLLQAVGLLWIARLSRVQA